VAFLLTAGVSFALASAGEGGRGAARARRLKRAVQLILLGYLLRAPFGVWFGDAWPLALERALAVDVLQCIGASLVLLELSCAHLVQPAQRALLGAGLAALCLGLGPASEHIVPEGLGLAGLNYLSARAGSLFPLLPWAGYVFAGLAVGQAVLIWRERAPVISRWRLVLGARLGAMGGALCAAAWLLFALLPAYPARVSPPYALLKLGLVVLVAALLASLLEGRRLPSLLRRLGSETLFLYASHVLLLYAGHVGLAARVGATQSLGLALGWAALLLLGCSAGALSYRRVQRALRARGGKGTPRAQPTSFPG
ncbi:MAG TPA: heparan-alpha-glucosaminide N-acetyltransferase domain-containing protein, partial [Polyangiales bacterium]